MTLSDIAPYILIAFIIFLNIALWTSFSKKGANQFFDLWRKAGTSIQKPWEKEDKNLQELSTRVEKLKQEKSDKNHDSVL